MTTEITVALLAFVGVAMSVFTSWMMTRIKLAAETRKLDVQVQINYAAAFVERRHAAYPELYQLLSDLVKKLQFENVTTQYLVDLRTSVEKWCR
uniref:Uncharacterized protein n=1 Tax=Candidatus Kentrum sp. SD TaxID=2126332 RepID=A0A451BQC3_9GAMM|nr:MAG: hypothetical protein BECKSD772D_GA0070982_111710 [Candidatus Kentron sp. SD]